MDTVRQVATAVLPQPGALVVGHELLTQRTAFGVLLLKQPVVRVPARAIGRRRPLPVPSGTLRRVRALQWCGRNSVRRSGLQLAQQRRIGLQPALDLRG